MLEKLSIRTQVLVTFAALATISLLIISAISLANIGNIGEITEEQATDALNDQIKRNILLSSSENADVIEKKFRNAEANVEKIARAAQAIFDGEIIFDPVPSFADTEVNLIPDAVNDPIYDEVISPTTSTYYHHASARGPQLTARQNLTIELSAHLDTVFASIYETTDEYVWMYFTFSPNLGSTFRNFPGADVPEELNPTEDPYYTEPIAEFGEITYVSPYFDETQGLIISVTKAVYDNTGSLIGAAGLDFKSSVVRDKVLDVSFLTSGYASLIEASTSVVIAHPEYTPDAQTDPLDVTIDTIETNDNGDSAFSDSKIIEITSGNKDVTTYTRNGETYYLSYAPIIENSDGSSEYIFLISVLVSEVIEPVDLISMRIQSSVSSITVSVWILSIITLLGTLAVGLWIAGNITRPVGRLTNIARQITKNATKEDIFDGVEFGEELASEDEIGDLSRSFQSMVGKLRDEQRQKSQKK